MPKKLLSPDAVREFLVRRFNNQHQDWLSDGGSWPLVINLGAPTEKDVADDAAGVRRWVGSWATWVGAGNVVWTERQLARLGTQRFPTGLCIATPEAVAMNVGQGKRWTQAIERFRLLIERWPALKEGGALSSKFNVLADYSVADFDRLLALLSWFDANPASNMYIRQLPIEGLDTKWLGPRTSVVLALLRTIWGAAEGIDFYDLSGLKKSPHRLRIRVLCPKLRMVVGGLRDIEAPIDEIVALPISPSSVVIVENQETGLALPDLANTVAFMKLGNAVSVLEAIPWLKQIRAIYWGDIDTHGYAILDRARRVLPQLESVHMDEQVLLSNRKLWGHESVQCPDVHLQHLTHIERIVYDGLRTDRWGQRVRLEQERVPWGPAIELIAAMLGFMPNCDSDLVL